MFDSIVEHIKISLSGDDAARLTKRREVREKLPLARERQQQLVSLQHEITNAEREIEAAVLEHQATCQPLQEQLTNATEDQRIKLRAKIDTANDLLESKVRQVRARIAQFQTEQNRLRLEPMDNPQVLENKLVDLANPELVCQHFVAQQSVTWAQHRLEAAQKQLEKWSDMAAQEKSQRTGKVVRYGESFGRMEYDSNAPPEEPELIYTRRAERWAAELKHAQELHRVARAESERVRQAMIDE